MYQKCQAHVQLYRWFDVTLSDDGTSEDSKIGLIFDWSFDLRSSSEKPSLERNQCESNLGFKCIASSCEMFSNLCRHLFALGSFLVRWEWCNIKFAQSILTELCQQRCNKHVTDLQSVLQAVSCGNMKSLGKARTHVHILGGYSAGKKHDVVESLLDS